MNGNGCGTKPVSAEEWRAYRDGKLDADRRDELEAHLYGCDECLQRLMSEIEAEPFAAEAGIAPARVQPDSPGFAERVMLAIAQANPAAQAQPDAGAGSAEQAASAAAAAQPPAVGNASATRRRPHKRRLSPRRRTMVQYAIAAAITVLLMASGVFRHIGERIDPFDTAANPERQEESLSERLLVKTTAVLDNIHTRTEGGAPRE